MLETNLLVRGSDDFRAGFGQIARFRCLKRESKRGRIGNDKAVAAIGCINRKRAKARDFNFCIEMARERRHVGDLNTRHFSIATVRLDPYQATGRFKCERRFGFDHRQNARLK